MLVNELTYGTHTFSTMFKLKARILAFSRYNHSVLYQTFHTFVQFQSQGNKSEANVNAMKSLLVSGHLVLLQKIFYFVTFSISLEQC